MPRWPADPQEPPTAEMAQVFWAQHKRRQHNPWTPPVATPETPLGRALAPLRASAALARFLGRSKETISRWKNGKSQPFLEDVPRIAHALAVLHEQGLCGPPPSVIEILYPFGFPEGCERVVADGDAERLIEQLFRWGEGAGADPTEHPDLYNMFAPEAFERWQAGLAEEVAHAPLPSDPPAE